MTSQLKEPEKSVLNQPFLKDLPKEKGVEIAMLLRISNMELKKNKADGTPAKRPYLMFTVSDRHSDVKCKKWDSSEEEFGKYKKSRVLFLTGRTDLYNGGFSIVAETLAEPDREVSTENLEALTPSTSYDVKFLKKGIWGLIQGMQNPWIKKLCELFVLDKQINERFSLVPAGVSRHHSFRHGLLEHTYRLMILACDFVDSYNKHSWPGNKVFLDKDTILAACLLHDMHKAFEYSPTGEYAIEGNLLGHIARGIMDIGTKTAQIEGFPNDLKELLVHCVSAHHGRTEWGSPDTPASPEAIITHYLDDLCSKLDPVVASLNFTSLENKWTSDDVRAIDKPAFLGNSHLV